MIIKYKNKRYRIRLWILCIVLFFGWLFIYTIYNSIAFSTLFNGQRIRYIYNEQDDTFIRIPKQPSYKDFERQAKQKRQQQNQEEDIMRKTLQQHPEWFEKYNNK